MAGQSATGSEGTPTSANAAARPTQRIAVLAVHGISDQQPFATARGVAGLLMNLDDGKAPLYASGDERWVDLRVRGLEYGPKPLADMDAEAAQPFQDYAEKFRAWRRSNPQAPISAHQEPGHAFLYGQIRGYQREEPHVPFDTMRVETSRGPGDAPVHVHVYEMYWADLSRLGRGWLRVLGEFYQILLHLGSVSVHTLRAASTQRLDKLWACLVWLAGSTAGMLSLPIAITNLLLFLVAISIVLSGVLARVDADNQPYVFAAICALAFFGAPAVGAVRYLSLKRYTLLAIPVAVVAFAAFVYPIVAVLANSIAIVAGGLYTYFRVLRGYDRHRPRALEVGIGSLLAVCAVAAFSASCNFPAELSIVTELRPQTVPPLILMRALDCGYAVINMYWHAFYVMLIATSVAALACRPAKGAERKAVFTGLLCLALPGLLFSVMTIVLWIIIGKILPPTLPDGLPRYLPFAGSAAAVSIEAFADAIVARTSVMFPYLAAAMLLAGAFIVLGLLPAVLAEKRRGKTPDDARRLGEWLSKGLTILAWVGAGVIATMVVVIPALVIARFLPDNPISRFEAAVQAFCGPLIQQLGGVLAGSAVGLFALVRRFDIVALKLGFLDPVLDVDNYLREHPRSSNPTARIFARYVSLLRYICNWTAANGAKYDRLIIVAHSQGTVITADLLRYLCAASKQSDEANLPYEPELDRIFKKGLPVDLFTMGSPLRQLYAPMFPHLYDYVGSVDEPFKSPDPMPLGVASWTNGFRAGDYVGRQLWQALSTKDLWKERTVARPWDVNNYEPPTQAENLGEFHAGYGAHTHYWDITAPMIAAQLDYLIRGRPRGESPRAKAASASGPGSATP